ncbi:3-oxo-tetronate kinase [uncultured Pelagimonas sp.]|uniref:3-oxo-tetronate kinase n=1 Tax=uncultured Pelagimonas sp. TaxID=1618102 RepID=UPI00260684A5|nr:3-oxo-tetronate kinase [uncultured Pelagimonas sp.]
MLIGVIADDFTGASDIANTLVKGVAPEGGLKTAQFCGIPTGDVAQDIEAGVISLKSRTAPMAKAVSDSLAALTWLLGQGCEQIIFKYCSTFDSTPDGNIGPVADALADALNAQGVVVCPAFPGAGRTVYQGHLFVGEKLLSESGMENHPLTPMRDPDLRRVLGRQSDSSIGLVPLSRVLGDEDKLREVFENATDRFVVADAVTDADLLRLGTALSNAKLMTGGSGIALGLPRNFHRAGKVGSNGATDAPSVTGPEAILAGSCSGATRGQIDTHAQNHPTLAIDVPGVMRGSVTEDTLVEFYLANSGNAPLAFSAGSPDAVADIQARFGREAVAHRLDELFANVAASLVTQGFKRIVVAGGETSGAVAQAVADAVGVSAMAVGPEIDPGIPILTLGEDAPVTLVLKSGNFGTEDFFAKALSMMAAPQ